MLLKTKAVQLWARRLHIYISMALLLVVLFFSVTGITLNRPELFVNSLPSVSEVELQLTDELMASGSCVMYRMNRC
ncbi:PepSY-associated TM helix domain-containing protein [uncultured Photobacterium sp.]|uniref:PepSY-associated TM helix domain-containing protein n=1 Tax=uncultured Photobacterium sp. TaxID=173973 RepID=UPI002612025A|nr:PepSY-associated TM helix domain-containing protein [uncultured Photobacterium sp.]